MKEPTIEEMRAFAKEEPGFLADLRKKMESDTGKLQEGCQVAAVQPVLVKAGLCTVEELNQFAVDAKPFIIDVSLAYLESDDAMAKAGERYGNWLKTGETS